MGLLRFRLFPERGNGKKLETVLFLEAAASAEQATVLHLACLDGQRNDCATDSLAFRLLVLLF